MAEEKTIKLLLSNGSLSGSIVAELSKWEGILFSYPRDSYLSLTGEAESKFLGVYLLISDSKVYIGRTRNFPIQIDKRAENMYWWDKVVLLTSKDNSLTNADIDYLVTKFIKQATDAGTLEASSNQPSIKVKSSRYREAELNGYIDDALLLLELIGIRVLNKNHTIELSNTKREPNSKVSRIKFFNVNQQLKILDRKEALRVLEENGYRVPRNQFTLARVQPEGHHWANPREGIIEKDWYLALNNQFTQVLTLFKIPSKTFSILEYAPKRLFVRSDVAKLDLNINTMTYIDKQSLQSFAPYKIASVSY